METEKKTIDGRNLRKIWLYKDVFYSQPLNSETWWPIKATANAPSKSFYTVNCLFELNELVISEVYIKISYTLVQDFY